MAAYIVTYKNEQDVLILTETVFMRTLKSAKSASTLTAPEMAYSIYLYDIGDKLLAFKEKGKWINV